jgi:hypothetical protein
MAKNNFSAGPWELKKGDIDNFVLVTEVNRKNAIVQGRILYFIDRRKTFNGTILIAPCLTKGYWRYPHYPWAIIPNDVQNKTHYRVYVDKGEDYNEWILTYKTLIANGIKNQSLYINPKDNILQFFKD